MDYSGFKLTDLATFRARDFQKVEAKKDKREK